MLAKVVLILAILMQLSYADSDPIKWSKTQKLTWVDFQEKAPTQDPHAARSRVEVRYESQVDKHGAMTMDIESIFIRELSWVKPQNKNDQLLHHEQYHFNITEVWARKLRKEIIGKRWNKKTLEKDFGTLFKKIMNALDKEQSAYDNQTNHSKAETIQAEWESKIDNELRVYEAFASTSVSFSFE
ncbi:MAG: DUF922 domain-containing protein [Cyclobacteriaceae bacterium]